MTQTEAKPSSISPLTSRVSSPMPWIFTFLTGPGLPKIRRRPKSEISIINSKTIADFTRVVDEMGVIKRDGLTQPAKPAEDRE